MCRVRALGILKMSNPVDKKSDDNDEVVDTALFEIVGKQPTPEQLEALRLMFLKWARQLEQLEHGDEGDLLLPLPLLPCLLTGVVTPPYQTPRPEL